MATKRAAPKKAAKKFVKSATKKTVQAKSASTKKTAVKVAAKKKAAPKKATPVSKATSQKKASKKVTSSVKPVSKKPLQKPVAKKQTPAKAAAVPVKKTAMPVKDSSIKKQKSGITKSDNSPIAKPAAKKMEPLKDVKVPKTSVKTSVPYKPDYKPLDQRAGTEKNSEPLIRYNDNDLTEFRDLINKKYDAAKKELAYLQGLITRKDEMGGDEAESRYMTMEDGSMSMEREQLSQMASRQITYIDHLEKALIRIENKTYGICRVTGKLIDKARLRAVPHATLSLEAKLGIVKPE